MNKPNIFRQVGERVRSQSGETLVETLVAVLVSALSMLMLANAIGSAVNIVSMGRRSSKKESAAISQLEKVGTTAKSLKVELTEVAELTPAPTAAYADVYTQEEPVPVSGGYKAISYSAKES